MCPPQTLQRKPSLAVPAPPIDTDLDRAAAILQQGGVVAIPTETVYGLAADALNPEAVRRVFAIKGRPADHPVIVHIAGADQLERWAREVPEAARILARRFWPGPLTLILPRRPEVPDTVTGGQDSVGLRVPAHPLALELLRRGGFGLAAPSANKFGRVSPTTPAHVAEELDGEVDMILDGGPCPVGVESTIVSLLAPEPVLLRPGGVSLAALEAALGRPVRIAHKAAEPSAAGVRAPGTLAAHYAPRTPLCLLDPAHLWTQAERLARSGLRVAVLALAPERESHGDLVLSPMPTEAAAYARLLYARLRELDGLGVDVILVERVPDTAEWLAVTDRLHRAAAHCPEEFHHEKAP